MKDAQFPMQRGPKAAKSTVVEYFPIENSDFAQTQPAKTSILCSNQTLRNPTSLVWCVCVCLSVCLCVCVVWRVCRWSLDLVRLAARSEHAFGVRSARSRSRPGAGVTYCRGSLLQIKYNIPPNPILIIKAPIL